MGGGEGKKGDGEKNRKCSSGGTKGEVIDNADKGKGWGRERFFIRKCGGGKRSRGNKHTKKENISLKIGEGIIKRKRKVMDNRNSGQRKEEKG